MIKLNRFFLGLAAYVLTGCGHSAPGHDQVTVPGDSVEQLTLLKNVYRWHDKHSQWVDFAVIVQDSFQTGLNYDSFNRRYDDTASILHEE